MAHVTAEIADTLDYVAAADGTQLARHIRRGSGVELGKRTPLLLTNGLSTTDNFWDPLVAAMARERPVIHWSYRGHGQSESAREDGYAVATHASDLERVTEKVASAYERPPIHVAFSMGVTVLLELYRRRPELVPAMVLIAGGADHPYASSAVARMPGVRAAARKALGAAAPIVPYAGPLTRRLTASRLAFVAARATGAIGKAAPRREVEHFFRSVGAMDLRAYWESMRSLLDAHASDVLPRVRVPVLVVSPERDVMAPPGDIDALWRAIPGAECMRVPGTGHAVLLEAGAAVAARVKAFVEGVKA
jgi:pimeloyl-ACP methyl ester carboxylesterase